VLPDGSNILMETSNDEFDVGEKQACKNKKIFVTSEERRHMDPVGVLISTSNA
jgi:hypothetical protein